MRRFILRLLNVFRRHRAERELTREMDAHLTLLEDEHVRRGMTREDARLAARRAMGSVALAHDLHRDARSFLWMEDLRRDARHGLRGLRRNPGFTAAVILTLALGIGANTAIFSVVDAVLIRPLPYPDSDRLVYLFEEVPAVDGAAASNRRPAMEVQTIADFRSQVRTLSDVSVQQSTTMTMATSGETVRLRGSNVSPAFLSLLGARPMLGRILESGDESAGGAAVVLLSHRAWERYFAGAPNVVGRGVMLDGRSYAVIGVMPRDFRFYPNPEAEIWTPFVLPGPAFLMLPVVARLNEGVSVAAALTEMTTVLQELRGSPEPARLAIVRVQDQMVAPARPALLVLSFAVAFVLLIACVNVANLILARTSTREREIAIRSALGAGHARIARLFLAESLLLAVAGGVVGIALAVAGVRLLHVLGATLPRPEVSSTVAIPRLAEVAVDAPTLVFAVTVSLLTGVLFGLAPTLGRQRRGAIDTLRGASSSPEPGRRHGLRSLLVVAEMGLALLLLVGATLMIASFTRLASVDPGYDPAGVVTFQVTLPEGRDMAAAAEDLVARLQSLPDVRAAGYSTDSPMVRGRGHMPLRSTPSRERPGPNEPTADPVYVSQDYLEAMGTRIVSGRGFADADRIGSPQVMLVNRSLVRSGMVAAEPIGTRVYALFRDPWEIVGVVEDIRAEALDQEPYPQFFVDLRQVPGFPFAEFRPYFAVRTGGDVTAVLANLRAIVHQVEPRASVDNVATVDQIVWSSIASPRLYTVLLGLFAMVAVALAAVGIFGLMAYMVEQRTREIGIRMALGARGSEVMKGVLGQSATLILIGVGIGLAAAAGLTRYLEGMLFGLTPLDPATFAAASVLFVVIALSASYMPARRATRVDPLIALRAE